MSRRFPISGECDRCGLPTASASDGAERNHHCLLQWSGERAPWPVVPDRWLANRTGVDVESLSGFMNQPSVGGRKLLRGVKMCREESVGVHGAQMRVYFNREDAERVAAHARQGRVVSTYIEGHTVHLDDVNGHPATIPARHLHIATRYAIQSDDGVATFGLHVFGRDALIGARDLLDNADRCTFAHEHFSCDAPAVFDLANPRDRCEDHPKETHA